MLLVSYFKPFSTFFDCSAIFSNMPPKRALDVTERECVCVCVWRGGGGADTILKLETISRQRPLCWHQRKENLYYRSWIELLFCLVYWRFWWFSPVRRSCPKASGCQTISFEAVQGILFKSVQSIMRWQHRGCSEGMPPEELLLQAGTVSISGSRYGPCTAR